MSKINNDIKEHFDFFSDLLNEEKIVLDKNIFIEVKKNNPYWLTGHTNIQHVSIEDNIIFIVERSKRDSKYGVKLVCKSLTPAPFFRFDSDGPAHRNDIPGIPLEEQSVPTPHFNSYNKDGNPIAYKNKTLKIEKEAIAIAKDINFGISLFCMESNMKLKDGNFPVVIDSSPELNLSDVERVDYAHINFE